MSRPYIPLLNFLKEVVHIFLTRRVFLNWSDKIICREFPSPHIGEDFYFKYFVWGGCFSVIWSFVPVMVCILNKIFPFLHISAHKSFDWIHLTRTKDFQRFGLRQGLSQTLTKARGLRTFCIIYHGNKIRIKEIMLSIECNHILSSNMV